MTSPRIVRAGLERVDDLRPLWQSLHAHHAEVAPQLAALGGVRTPAESWGRRRALYEDWLSEPDAFALIAEADSVPVGYALVHMRGPEETWSTPDRIAEIETLTVLPAPPRPGRRRRPGQSGGPGAEQNRCGPPRGGRDRLEHRGGALL